MDKVYVLHWRILEPEQLAVVEADETWLGFRSLVPADMRLVLGDKVYMSAVLAERIAKALEFGQSEPGTTIWRDPPSFEGKESSKEITSLVDVFEKVAAGAAGGKRNCMAKLHVKGGIRYMVVSSPAEML